jgi:hypothetical protein
LFGRPTDLPWGLEIDIEHRPSRYVKDETFHPTFLYESIYCLALAVFLVRAERRFGFKRGQTFALYVSLYCIERFFMELLRVDEASKLFGVRFNALLSIVLAVGGAIVFVALGRRGSRAEAAATATPSVAPDPTDVSVVRDGTAASNGPVSDAPGPDPAALDPAGPDPGRDASIPGEPPR